MDTKLDDLLKEYDAYINFLARNIYVDGYTKEDIVQEFRMEVINAHKQFDPNKGVKFITFMTAYIKTR